MFSLSSSLAYVNSNTIPLVRILFHFFSCLSFFCVMSFFIKKSGVCRSDIFSCTFSCTFSFFSSLMIRNTTGVLDYSSNAVDTLWSETHSWTNSTSPWCCTGIKTYPALRQPFLSTCFGVSVYRSPTETPILTSLAIFPSDLLDHPDSEIVLMIDFFSLLSSFCAVYSLFLHVN